MSQSHLELSMRQKMSTVNIEQSAVDSILPPEIRYVIHRRRLNYALWFAVPFVVTLTVALAAHLI